MSRNKIIPYRPHLKFYARELRKNSTLGEVILWIQIKKRALGVQFHRQVPIDHFIVDFYCHEIMLAIEIDGPYHNHPYKIREDRIRQQRLEFLGVRFVRYTESDIRQNLDEVLRHLKDEVDSLLGNLG